MTGNASSPALADREKFRQRTADPDTEYHCHALCRHSVLSIEGPTSFQLLLSRRPICTLIGVLLLITNFVKSSAILSSVTSWPSNSVHLRITSVMPRPPGRRPPAGAG